MRSQRLIAGLSALALLHGLAPSAWGQRQPAPPVTDPADPRFLTAQTRKMGGPMPAEQMALTFEKLDLTLKVFPSEKRIEGIAALDLSSRRALDTLVLDFFPKFAIDQITLDGEPIPADHYANPEGQLRIDLPRPLARDTRITVRIAYRGTPPLAKRPPWEGGTTWTTTPDGKYPWIDTSLWGGGCDMLYPCLDHPTLKPARSELHYIVPEGLMAPGNGHLVSAETRDGWTTWNWSARSVHTYGSVLNVGPYKVKKGDYQSRFGNTIPMRFYYLPGEESQADALFAEFPRTLDFWESVIGPYPWSDQKMGVIRVPFSGLENQTLNGYSDEYPKTPFGWDWLVNHEFSHEWFANQLSVANYDDLWLHEGLGSYAQPLLAEFYGGRIDYMAQLKGQRAAIRNDQPLVSGRNRDEKAVYSDPTGPRGDIYQKGSWVAHSLRQLIGDDAFFESIRRLVYGRPDPRPGNFTPQFGTTQGFVKIVNTVTGKDYGWFFDVYLYQAAVPRILVTRTQDKAVLRWDVPGDLPFPMPLDVRVGDRIVTLPMTDGSGEVTADRDTHVLPDPYSKILVQSDAIVAYQQWKAQQAKSGQSID
ncbi:M1 family metallopeptidase [Novosphingobium sp. YJ-S2-02]|uniref:Aminopeptidase N n=1 Tax=Novosphingobium aureum TaxID=2792964 RepID=A0A931HBY1_9SPHN|nr:M1 family metallopeptidase [Novosphingobium aureum]MBH0112683.1 M1 family metallopeptidase [Novosphingobium aureum]